jgi:ERG8-type phosphomevalonate kinase/isopentenyl-diphosphate delta-isomerase type 2
MTGGGASSQELRSGIATAPGKLYVAGEYAVVEHGHPAILVAVNRWLTAKVTECATGSAEAAVAGSDSVGRIHSQGHPEASVTWRRRAGRAVPDLDQPGAAFVLSVIHSVEELVSYSGETLAMYDVTIESELDDKSGRKYGLGSSAAVTVATMRALLDFYGLDLSPMQQYKLAFAAASRAQKVGSGGDLAASLFGGCIRFTSVDRQWVVARLQDTPLAELIDMPWPGLSVARLHALGARNRLGFMVGWTGDPASTPNLVSRVQGRGAAERERMYHDFLDRSDACVNALADALQDDDERRTYDSVRQARMLLAGLSTFTGTLIETPMLRELAEVAEAHGGAGKSSGAGGGDCGIAIVGPEVERDKIADAWREKGIVPLDLALDEASQVEIATWTGDSKQDESADFPVFSAFRNPCDGDGSTRTKVTPNANGGEQAGFTVDDEADAPVRGAGTDTNRKDDHVRLALAEHADRSGNAFDDARFVHHSLAGIDPALVDISVDVLGAAHWGAPFYINAMTGGSEKTGAINTALAQVAHTTGVPIASGSQHAALRDPALEGTFATIREHDPDGFVFANIGPDVGVDGALAAVRMLDADALQIHLNSAQEIVMPEGTRDFSLWPERIAAIVKACPVPVVVKEVGFGMSADTVRRLARLGVRSVDVSGCGGTDFARIENTRREKHEYAYLDGWGQSTVLCLLALDDAGEDEEKAGNTSHSDGLRIRSPRDPETASASMVADAHLGSAQNLQETGGADDTHGATEDASGLTVFASGGVRTPLDVVKALALGARAVGVSGHFLQTLASRGTEGLTSEINAWKDQVRSLMALLGTQTVADLAKTDLLITGRTAQEASLLGVDLAAIARRSRQ